VALKVILEVPVADGVPVISPVFASAVNPCGRPVAPKLVGLLEAVIWYRNATLTVACASKELVMTGGKGGSAWAAKVAGASGETVAVTWTGPGDVPSVRVICAAPLESVNDVTALSAAGPDETFQETNWASTGTPACPVTCTTNGFGSAEPCGGVLAITAQQDHPNRGIWRQFANQAIVRL